MSLCPQYSELVGWSCHLDLLASCCTQEQGDKINNDIFNVDQKISNFIELRTVSFIVLGVVRTDIRKNIVKCL